MHGSADPQGSAERQALLCALAAVALWSTVATGFKLGLQQLAPLQLLFAGSLISAVVFAAAAAVTRSWIWTARAIGQSALFGLVNPLLYYLILFEAYDRLPAQIAQPLNYTWAITLALLAVPLLKQPLSRRALAGIVVSYLGVLVLLSQGRVDAMPPIDPIGVACALASTVLWAGYWLMNARTQIPPLALMAWSFCLATPLIGVACLLGPGLPPLSTHTLVFGSWVGCVEMGVTFLLWQRALRLTRNAARVGQLIFLSPFGSLVLIATVLGEAIHPATVAGLALIVAGLLLAPRPAPP